MRRKLHRSLRRPMKQRCSRAKYFRTVPQNRGNPAAQSRASKSPQGDRIGRPPDNGIFIGKGTERCLTQSRGIGKPPSKEAKAFMRSPNIRILRRLSLSGCRGYFICFANYRKLWDCKAKALPRGEAIKGTKARLVRAMSARPPGIFASARRKGNPFCIRRPDQRV